MRFSFDTPTTGLARPSIKRSAALSVGLLLTIVACGGTAAPTAPRASTAAPAASQAASTAAASTAASTNAPVVAPTTAPNPVAGTLEACSLLTPAEVTAAYGDTVDTAAKESDASYSYCTYTGGGGAKVKTWVTQDPAVVPTVFATMKINKGEPVSGVGDEAYWSTDSYAPGIYFLKGTALGYISGSQTGPDDAIVELGKLMAGRM